MLDLINKLLDQELTVFFDGDQFYTDSSREKVCGEAHPSLLKRFQFYSEVFKKNQKEIFFDHIFFMLKIRFM